MFCVSCGTKLPSDAAFCPNCGAKIGLSSASAGGQSSAPCADGENRQSTNKDVVPYSKFEKYRDITLFSLLCYGVFRGIIAMWKSDWECADGQLSNNIIFTILLLLLVSLGFMFVHRRHFKKSK